MRAHSLTRCHRGGSTGGSTGSSTGGGTGGSTGGSTGGGTGGGASGGTGEPISDVCSVQLYMNHGRVHTCAHTHIRIAVYVDVDA